MTNEIIVDGVVARGHGVASGQAPDSPYPDGTIRMQMARFRERGLDLNGIYPATLNVSIRPFRFRMVAPERTFRGVDWCDEHPPEDFSFSCCRLRYAGTTYDAFVYYPHPETKIRHYQDPHTIEVLAPWIEGLTYGDAVQLVLDADTMAVSRES